MPYLPVDVVRRTAGVRTSFDAGRGCPFLCSFCTIINVQGRKSRARSADDVERLVRANLAQGVHNFFITDDNLARNQNWEAIFDRLIAMREEEGLRIHDRRPGRHDGAQDPRLHREGGPGRRQPRVHRPGEHQPGVAEGRAAKARTSITEYRAMLQAWHRVGALTYAGYILGFPGRHAGVDRARHPHHPARAADRPPRVLHPDAAARLRRPQEAAPRGRARWSAT